MEFLKASALAFLVAILISIAAVCVVTIPLQIATIVIGAKYKDECPVENTIPISLIVVGTAGLFSNFTNCCSFSIRRRIFGEPDEEWSVNPVQVVAHLFLLVWFVCGNVWIYKNYEPTYTDPGSADYCHKTLYLFAFWVTNSYYIIFELIVVLVCLGEPCQAAVFKSDNV